MLMLSLSVQAEVVVIVDVDSSVNTLTTEQVARIFLKKQNSFSSGESPVPIDQPKGVLRDTFYEKYVGKNRSRISAYWAQRVFTGYGTPPAQATSDDEMVELVSSIPNAIGYVDRESVTPEVKIVATEP